MATYTWNSTSTNPTVEDWIVTPQFKTIVTEFDSGKRVRNSKWSTPRYNFTIKYRTPVQKTHVTAIKDFFIARRGDWENFDLYITPLGVTHTVSFAKSMENFDYFMQDLARFSEVSFIQEVV